MFGFLRFFGGEEAAEPLSSMGEQSTDFGQSYAPGTRIAYDPDLVRRLKQENQRLMALFTELVNSVPLNMQRGHLLLQEFEQSFNSYVLLEFTKLYIYLESCLKSDPKRHAVIREYRRKMTSVSRLVRAFNRRWRAQLNENRAQQFLNHARQVGQLLFARMKDEQEHLYQIYEHCPQLVLQLQSEQTQS